MQPRTLDQVISSLGSIYDPQIQSVKAQQDQLPQQLQNDESALQGQQTTAFNDILNGARRRGTGVAFGGIPLGEQAQYTATSFLPAMANLRSTYATKSLSLTDAINQINERRSTQGQSIYEGDRNFAEQQRQFNEQQAFSREQAAASAKAAASAAASPTLGLPAKPTAGGQNDPLTTPNLAGGRSIQDAYNAVEDLMQSRNTPLIAKTYQAIYSSAQRGNNYDQTKLQILNQKYGNTLLKNGIGQAGAGGSLSY